ncbi:ABC transporter substrate-binding protein [Catenuloplanes atrovinosus]|uniref:ABC-type branched-subunit amino acid transport system substrate-binding protein n=1 Tax=Catenuloplanes atrovinosus TaxID=137266 RepID=A0AAE4C942_9ACTN|nr:ABC transporter substrate-binding protein [Catenuloplanes atrovinosus]MDR7276176.1 ABC-type branched-subunit amino acid transport system substrate-binding protein [Catenuloplanes atrovinosus]
MLNSRLRRRDRAGRSPARRPRGAADVVHTWFVAVTLIASVVALAVGLYAAWVGLDNIVSTLTMLIGVSGVGLTAVQTVPAIVRHVRQAWRPVGYLLVAALVVATSYATWVVAHKPVIKIAVSMPFLDVDPRDARAVLRGVGLAVAAEQFVADGVPIEIVPFDDHDLAGGVTYMSPDGSHLAGKADGLRTVLDDAQIAGVIGPFHSDTALEEIPVVSAAGIPMISPSNTLTCLTHRGEVCESTPIPRDSTYFRMAVTDEVRAEDLATRLAAHLSKRLAVAQVVVAEDATTFGQGLAASFEREWRERRPSDRLTRLGVADARERIIAGTVRPDLVLYCGTGLSGGMLYEAVQSRRRASPSLFVGPATIMNGGLTQWATAAGELYAVAPSPYDDTRGQGNVFKGHYRFRFTDGDPSPYAAAAYDATRALIMAIEKAMHGHVRPPVAERGPFMRWRADDLRRRTVEALRTFNRGPGFPDYENPVLGAFWFDDRGDVVFRSARTAIYQYGDGTKGVPEWQFVR